MADVIFVATDFEGTFNIQNAFLTSRESQPGISILDSRDLLRRADEPGTPPIISTQNFFTGSPQRCIKVLRNFKFGISDAISNYDVAAKIRECMKPKRDEKVGEHRQVVMVCHGYREECMTIASVRISTKNYLNSGFKILDTAHKAADFLHRSKGQPMSSQDLAAELGIPFEKDDFHVAVLVVL